MFLFSKPQSKPYTCTKAYPFNLLIKKYFLSDASTIKTIAITYHHVPCPVNKPIETNIRAKL